MPAWMTDPNGYALSLGLALALLLADGIRWAMLGARSTAPRDNLRARMLRGMEQSPSGQRWLRHPWFSGAGTVILVAVFGAIFNARFRS